MITFHHNKGFVVVEALLSASLLLIVFVALIGIIVYNQKDRENLSNRQRALFLAQEGLEASRSIRDGGFSSLSDGSFGITTNSGKWAFSPSPDSQDSFSRQVTISTVSPEIKKVDCLVSWLSSNNATKTVSLSTYLSDWRRGVETNCWSNPFAESGLSIGNCDSGSEVVTSGDYAYMTKAGTNYFSIINISNTAAPTLMGYCQNSNCSLSGNLRSVVVSGNYAYVTSTTDNAELYTIDISNKSSPRRVDTYNASGSADGRVLWVSGNRLYMTREYDSNSSRYEFLVMNLSNPADPTLLGGLNLENACTDVVVVGNYAYVACSDSTREFQVIDVSNPSSMSLSRRYALNLPDTDVGWSISVSGNTAYVGKNGGMVYSINISNPTTPSIISSYNYGGAAYKSTMIDSNTLVVAGANGTEEVQYIDVSDPSSMTKIGSSDIPGGNFNSGGVYYDQAKNRIFASGACLSGNSSREFVIIGPNCE
jgi:hypothetical protein